jgi:hypothetical protein
MKRRSEKHLRENIKCAKTGKVKARAYYELGLFHDNNAREAEAVPRYRQALRLGLDKKRKSRALAWLASSLWKAGKPKEALLALQRSERTADKRLKKFLADLKKRIGTKR